MTLGTVGSVGGLPTNNVSLGQGHKVVYRDSTADSRLLSPIVTDSVRVTGGFRTTVNDGLHPAAKVEQSSTFSHRSPFSRRQLR